jgi:hypothetical protein
MQQSARTRSLQHLLLQGFTLYPCHAAVCVWLASPSVLLDASHPWAIAFDTNDSHWMSNIPSGDSEPRALALMREASVRAATEPMALVHAMGEFLVLPLEVPEVRNARMRIEAAVTLGKAPPTEKLGAFSDKAIEAEVARRRKRQKAENGTGQSQPEA